VQTAIQRSGNLRRSFPTRAPVALPPLSGPAPRRSLVRNAIMRTRLTPLLTDVTPAVRYFRRLSPLLRVALVLALLIALVSLVLILQGALMSPPPHILHVAHGF
jgi:hypothetical protein